MTNGDKGFILSYRIEQMFAKRGGCDEEEDRQGESESCGGKERMVCRGFCALMKFFGTNDRNHMTFERNRGILSIGKYMGMNIERSF